MCLAVSWRRSICYCHLKVFVFLFNPVNKLVTQQSRAPCSHLSAGLLPELVSGEGCEQGDKWAHQVWGSYLSDQVLYQLSIKGSLPSPSFWTVNLPLNNLSGKNSFLKQIFINFQNFQKKNQIQKTLRYFQLDLFQLVGSHMAGRQVSSWPSGLLSLKAVTSLQLKSADPEWAPALAGCLTLGTASRAVIQHHKLFIYLSGRVVQPGTTQVHNFIAIMEWTVLNTGLYS